MKVLSIFEALETIVVLKFSVCTKTKINETIFTSQHFFLLKPTSERAPMRMVELNKSVLRT